MNNSFYSIKKKKYIHEGFIATKGYGIVATSVMEDQDISYGAKSLYVYLLCKTGGGTKCFPSNKIILSSLGIKSNITLRKYKDELVLNGLLRIEERKYKSGRLASNFYFPTKFKSSKVEEDDYD